MLKNKKKYRFWFEFPGGNDDLILSLPEDITPDVLDAYAYDFVMNSINYGFEEVKP